MNTTLRPLLLLSFLLGALQANALEVAGYSFQAPADWKSSPPSSNMRQGSVLRPRKIRQDRGSRVLLFRQWWRRWGQSQRRPLDEAIRGSPRPKREDRNNWRDQSYLRPGSRDFPERASLRTEDPQARIRHVGCDYRRQARCDLRKDDRSQRDRGSSFGKLRKMVADSLAK